MGNELLLVLITEGAPTDNKGCIYVSMCACVTWETSTIIVTI